MDTDYVQHFMRSSGKRTVFICLKQNQAQSSSIIGRLLAVMPTEKEVYNLLPLTAMGASREEHCIRQAFHSSSGSSLSREELQFLFCIWEDDLKVYRMVHAESAREVSLDVDLDALKLIHNYKAAKFEGKKSGFKVIHIAALFSAHGILQEVLKTLPPEVHRAQTSDSLTAIHISAALGDYLALRMLIENNVPVTHADSKGRTALHYAAQTNIESMIVILAESNALINYEDQNGRIPLEYCDTRELRRNYKFLDYHRRQLSIARKNVVSSEVDRDIQEKLRSAPFLFDSYLCLRPQRGAGVDAKEACNCYWKDERHERFSAKSDLQELMKRRHRGFVARPTGTFGQFESALSPVISQYIRIADETTFDKIHTLLFTIWRLPKPDLVLTFYGSDPKLAALTKLLQRSLGKITRQTRTWLLTDGKLGGTADLVAQAMRGYTEAYGMKELQVIALTPWALLANAESLRSDDFLGKTRFSLPQKTYRSDKRIQLAENHTHYLLIDTKEKKMNNMAVCRAQFEAWISRLTESATDEAQKYGKKDALRLNSNFATTSGQTSEVQPITAEKTPVCGVLVGGGKEHLQGVKNALNQKTPFVVISDSGGLANVLERCVDMMRKKKASPDQKLRWSSFNMNLKKIADAVKGIWDLEEGEVVLLENILNHAYLLEFISSSESKGAELDARIVKSLTKSELFEGVDANEIWKFRLRMALQLNRTDFLSENMFAGVQWDKVVMATFVELGLSEDKRDFLQLLLDSGFPLHEYITFDLIEKLYQIDFESNKPRAEIFKILVSTSYKPMPTTITMKVVHTVLSRTLGHKLNKMNFKKEHEKAMLMVDQQASFETSVIDSDGEDGEIRLLHLLIWAFICRRFELSHLVWLLMKEPIPAALLLVNLAQQMKKTQQALKEKDELQRMAMFYERMAVGVLDECHSNGTANTLRMLCMARPAYGRRSQLLLAEEGKCKHFIEHQASQTCVKRVWFGNISELISLKRYSFCIIMGIVYPPIIPLIVEYRENRQTRSPQNPPIQYPGLMNRSGDQSRREKEGPRCERRNAIKTYFKRLKDFYCAPQTRFVYNFILTVLLIIAFSAIILFWTTDPHAFPTPIFAYVLFAGILLENIRATTVKRHGFRRYLYSGWNLIFLACTCLFILGNISIMTRIEEYRGLVWLTRLFLAVCLLVGFAFLFRFFGVSRSIGPKLLMIHKMVLGDLLPFLAIIVIFWISFTVFLVVIIQRPVLGPYYEPQIQEFFASFRNSFFAMFGEFNIGDNIERLDKLEEECPVPNGCTYPFYSWSYPLVYGIYVLCTHVILINLLIAMFTKRYSQMESESKQLWAMQQFGLVKTFANAPPLPPTLMFLWPFVCIYEILTACCKGAKRRNSNPFCRQERNERHERQLISWQKFCSLDFLRHNKLTLRLALEHPKLATKESKDKGFFIKGLKDDLEDRSGKDGSDKHRDTESILESLTVLQNNIEEMAECLVRVNPEAFQLLRFATPKPEAPAGDPEFKESTLRVTRSSVRKLSSLRSFSTANRPIVAVQDIESKQSIHFNGEELRIAFFLDPIEELIPERLAKTIPWDVDAPLYQPAVLESADETVLRWIGKTTEEPAEPPDPLPQNPLGRTGVDGRGHLPAYGENKAFYLVFTLDEKWDNDRTAYQSQSVRRQVLLRSAPSKEKNLPWVFRRSLQRVNHKLEGADPDSSAVDSDDVHRVLHSKVQQFICNHAPTEDKKELLEILLLAYMQRMALELAENEPESYDFHSNLQKELEKCDLNYYVMGFLEDEVNCDNAWIDVTAIHIQVPGSYRFWELLPQLLSGKNVEAKWEDLGNLPPIRESHFKAIAVFNEKLIRA